ncbi:MAG: PD40 domain-containing protein [Acidobacteria bacterium]|nr:PD40 domain-containing protein [Acidobacteriota bacterium]
MTQRAPAAAVAALAAALASAPSGQTQTAPPATDIFLAPIRLLASAPTMGPARVVSENPNGYDNQPFFGPDGRAMLFTSNRDGKQTDIYFLELQTRQIRQFTSTPESEYSPTLMPDEAGVSVIRVEADGSQRIWRFDEGAAAPSVIAPAVKPAGYHVWIDADRLAVYVLGQPATLQIVDVTTRRAKVVASDIGRSLLRRPSGTMSFVQREAGAWHVKEWVPSSGEVRDLVPALAGSADRDAAWAPDGTLFMTKDGEVHWWRPGQSGWTLLADPGIGTLSRLAVSPDGRWLAIVAAERR